MYERMVSEEACLLVLQVTSVLTRSWTRNSYSQGPDGHIFVLVGRRLQQCYCVLRVYVPMYHILPYWISGQMILEAAECQKVLENLKDAFVGQPSCACTGSPVLQLC